MSVAQMSIAKVSCPNVYRQNVIHQNIMAYSWQMQNDILQLQVTEYIYL